MERVDRGHGPPPGLQPSALGEPRTGGCSYSPALWVGRLAHRLRSGASCTQVPPLPASHGTHLSRVLLAWGHTVETPQLTTLWVTPEFLRALGGACRTPRARGTLPAALIHTLPSPASSHLQAHPAQRSARGWVGCLALSFPQPQESEPRCRAAIPSKASQMPPGSLRRPL